MASRLGCVGCGAGGVKYDDAPKEPKKGIKRRLTCTKWKCKAKTAPASSVEDSSESNDNHRQTEDTPMTPDVVSPTVSTRNKHSKSYSSVSSMGRRLVERLADEVVEDFMAAELMSPLVSPTSLPSIYRFDTPEEDAPLETMTDSAIEDIQRTPVEEPRILTDEIGEEIHDYSMEVSQEEELVDSASDNHVGSVRKRCDFFERYSVSTKVDEIKDTADMKPTPELEMEQCNRRSHPTPLRITDRGGGITIASRVLERVASGGSWILEDAKQISRMDGRLLDLDFRFKGRSRGETCVLRRVFHASSLADEENDSSDGSVISVEIDSCPRDDDDDHRCSLAWMPRARGQMTY